MPPKTGERTEISPAHLAEGERDHDEEDAAQPHRERAQRQRRSCSSGDGGGERGAGRQLQEMREARERIGAEAEVEGMPERDEAGIAGDEIEAHGEDRPDGDLAQQVFPGIVREAPGGERPQQQQRPGGVTRPLSAHARWRAGRRPPGRSSSTSAITA